MAILYWPPDPCAQLPKDLAQTHLNAEDWTIRWMSAQLQDNHAERCGMWSWNGRRDSAGGHAAEMAKQEEIGGDAFLLSTATQSWTASSARFCQRPRMLLPVNRQAGG